ncbi:IclR family transcriptional regulator [Nesterenkonia sp. F]|uniref:IclR family transcriptional regulator n=1 Tax=Nesterenkonia sp. F TaxID=795955 RepID=UPI000255D15D|nr:IclR family transcriptional regulator [Nesterenkonia sp. F]
MSESLRRALTLLDQLAHEPSTLDEIAGRTDAHKTTVMRQLHTLEDCRFVVRDARGRYRIGSKVLELSALALEERSIVSVARPHLQQLNRATGHTVHLAAFEGPDVVYIDKLESRHAVRMYSRVGLTAPLHATAVAKVLIADLPAARREHIATSLDYRRFTDQTISGPQEYLAALDDVAARGWAMDDREHEEFVHCVAAPVRDASGRAVAAVSTSVPVVLADSEQLLALVPSLTAVAEAASADLGWNPTERT